MNNIDNLKNGIKSTAKHPPNVKELAEDVVKLRLAVESILDLIKTRNF